MHVEADRWYILNLGRQDDLNVLEMIAAGLKGNTEVERCQGSPTGDLIFNVARSLLHLVRTRNNAGSENVQQLGRCILSHEQIDAAKGIIPDLGGMLELAREKKTDQPAVYLVYDRDAIGIPQGSGREPGQETGHAAA